MAIFSASVAPDPTSLLRRISEQLKSIVQQTKQQSQKVQTFRRNSADVVYDNSATSRSIGTLETDRSRLNIVSALSRGDRVDNFAFHVATSAATQIGALGNLGPVEDTLHIQIIDKASRQTIADNQAIQEDTSDNYAALRQGSLTLAKGDYLLRITRRDGVDPAARQTFNYAIQINQGSYSRDYDTVEKAYQNGSDPYGVSAISAATSNLVEGITQAANFIQQLPPLGQQATEKLTGGLYDALF
ncbi:MAG TPA: hypothetical protein VHL08_02365 [Dongiaceae bacterium]|jgi:hypothetical protein|nr:hypothetical protein [Dongiaceae bacterium]